MCAFASPSPHSATVKYNSKVSTIYHHHQKSSERSLYKKAVKSFAIFTEKHVLESFLNKKGLQSWSFILKRLQHRFFTVNLANCLRTPGLKNICERLLERFPTWVNNITSNTGIEEDISPLYLHYMSQTTVARCPT